MSRGLGALVGAALGFAYRAYQYIGAVPEGASIDSAGLVGFGLSGALIGGIIGAVLALVIGVFKRKA